MRKRLAQVLTMILVVGFGAAQWPLGADSRHGKTSVSEKVFAAANISNWFLLHETKSPPYQVGTASWYGEDFDGKPTASGEPYNMFDLTAAHPSLPLGTLVKVTNLRNRRSVVVRINDRGPVVAGRIIDLSYSAAKVLKFHLQGIQRVRLDLVPAPKVGTTMALLMEPQLNR